jgi:hypothetical protein
MTNSLMQINITYVPLEDRLLWRMTSGKPGSVVEYRIWLTRRCVRMLWKILEEMAEGSISADYRLVSENVEAIKQFQQAAVLSQADFKTPYRSEEAQMPLGAQPLLVSGFKTGKGPEGKQILYVQLANDMTLNLSMNPPLIHSLWKLLADMTRQADWNLNIPFFIETEAADTEKVPKRVN